MDKQAKLVCPLFFYPILRCQTVKYVCPKEDEYTVANTLIF